MRDHRTPLARICSRHHADGLIRLVPIVLIAGLVFAALPGIALPGAGAVAKSGSTTIRGQIKGYDDHAPRQAHVRLTAEDATPIEVRAKKDGSFELTTNQLGPADLIVRGVDHQALSVPLFLEGPSSVDLDVRLKALDLPARIDSVRILGSFNGYNARSGKSMTLGKDGTYSFDLVPDSALVRYQLLVWGDSLAGRPVPFRAGTDSDDYEPDASSSYRSIKKSTPGKSLHLVFDPKKARVLSLEPNVRFADPTRNRVASLIEENTRILTAWVQNYRQANGRPDLATLMIGQSEAALRRTSDQIAAEKDPLLRQLLLVRYLKYATLWDGTPYDTTLVREAIRTIPAASRVWQVDPPVASALESLTGGSPEATKLVDDLLDSNPDAKTRRAVLFGRLVREYEGGDTVLVRKTYERLQRDFAQSMEAKRADEQFNPNRRIMVGKEIPDFSFTTIDAPVQTLTKKSLQGKTYLLDFWATWCGPCRGEIPNLERVHEEFKGKPFQLISVSLDRKLEDIAKYRASEHKMPWAHAFVDRNQASDVNRRFEIAGIPRPILVGPDGRILALSSKLRGDRLEQTIAEQVGRP